MIDLLVVAASTPQPGQSALSDLWSGLFGALFGGALAFVAAWWQTKKVLAHERQLAKDARDYERQQAQEARDHERKQAQKARDYERQQASRARSRELQDERRRRQEQALAGLLPILHQIELSLSSVRETVTPSADNESFKEVDATETRLAYDALLHARHIELPLVTIDEVHERFRNFHELFGTFTLWGLDRLHLGSRNRQHDDVDAYLLYVRHTVKNALHGRELPPHAAPPDLSRDGDEPWAPPIIDPEEIKRAHL